MSWWHGTHRRYNRDRRPEIRAEVVAEGIEAHEAGALARAVGCPVGQCFLFCLLMPTDRIGMLVGAPRVSTWMQAR